MRVHACVLQHHLEPVIVLICPSCSSMCPGLKPITNALQSDTGHHRPFRVPSVRALQQRCALLASGSSPHCSGRIKHGRRPGDGVLIPPTNRVPSSVISSPLLHQPKECTRGILGYVVLIGKKDATNPTIKNYNSQKSLSTDDWSQLYLTYV